MHLLTAKMLKFCNSLKMKLLEDKGTLQNPAGWGFSNAILRISFCQHIFSLPPSLSKHYKKVFTNFFKANQVDFLLKEEKNSKTDKTTLSNGVIQLLACKPQKQAHHIQKHINFRKNIQHNLKNPP